MNKKTAVVAIIVMLVIAVWFGIRFFIGGNEDTWICDNGQWVRHGNPSAPKPTEECKFIKYGNLVSGQGSGEQWALLYEEPGGDPEPALKAFLKFNDSSFCNQGITNLPCFDTKWNIGNLGDRLIVEGSLTGSTVTVSKLFVQNPLISVSSPTLGEVIKSPYVIKGEAKGPWYFEASFPVRLLDGDGNIFVQTQATAKSDWMTENFVPFEANLEFNVSQTDEGTLVLVKDNPSDLPQNAAEIRIPIKFR
ncbi:MAG: hypothetical protein CEN90_562 [Parcubacteria group bacterium Licking1014_17]|nr:MAG: hypothetical protein CEN90_562 [Parcubacteria group bacterium Licking1014_17]